jgi:hypothetical protein
MRYETPFFVAPSRFEGSMVDNHGLRISPFNLACRPAPNWKLRPPMLFQVNSGALRDCSTQRLNTPARLVLPGGRQVLDFALSSTRSLCARGERGNGNKELHCAGLAIFEHYHIGAQRRTCGRRNSRFQDRYGPNRQFVNAADT